MTALGRWLALVETSERETAFRRTVFGVSDSRMHGQLKGKDANTIGIETALGCASSKYLPLRMCRGLGLDTAIRRWT